MSGPETLYTNRIRRRCLKAAPELYHMKNQAGHTSGIPDLWFSGDKQDLWVEMKWEDRTIKTERAFLATLSPLQQRWLDARYAQGRSVGVITGHAGGGLIQLDGAWNEPMTTADFLNALRPIDEIVAWIIQQTMERA
jgi:hypothetical protein